MRLIDQLVLLPLEFSFFEVGDNIVLLNYCKTDLQYY